MSRLGKKGIEIPKGTEVNFDSGVVKVKGPKGQLELNIKPKVSVSVSDNIVSLNADDSNKEAKTLWGTYSSIISNMIEGVNDGFQKKLIVEGVGFKVEVKGKEIEMQLGYSHPIIMDIPDGIDVSVNKNEITIDGVDKELVGQFAANIRSQKKPEPYKGKGIRYADEVIRRKEGKRAVTA